MTPEQRTAIIAALPVSTSSSIKDLRAFATQHGVAFGERDSWNTVLYKIQEDAVHRQTQYYRIQTISGRILEHVEYDYEGNIHNYMGEISQQNGVPLDEMEFVVVTGQQIEEEANA